MSFSIAIAHTAIDATKSPIMTSLTTKSACWNKSQIEIGAPDGMASPCGCLFRCPAKGVQTRAQDAPPPRLAGADWINAGLPEASRQAMAPARPRRPKGFREHKTGPLREAQCTADQPPMRP